MKIDVIVPAYRFIDPECDAAITAMVAHTASQGFDVRMPRIKGHALPHRVRNEVLVKLRHDVDWVLWVDDDMYPTGDSLVRLLKHAEGEHLVSALTTTRDEWPPKLIPKAWSREDDRFIKIPEEDWQEHMGKVIRGPFGVGFGFALTSKQVLDEAIDFYLSGQDWMLFEARQLNRLHVRKENREKERARIELERRNRYEEQQFLRVFQHSVQDNELERGEDVHFSRVVLELGHHVTIDTTVQVPHMGKCPFGPQLIGVNDYRQLRIPA
jgi:hypothetical protein